jgi:hypothetical protein
VLLGWTRVMARASHARAVSVSGRLQTSSMPAAPSPQSARIRVSPVSPSWLVASRTGHPARAVGRGGDPASCHGLSRPCSAGVRIACPDTPACQRNHMSLCSCATQSLRVRGSGPGRCSGTAATISGSSTKRASPSYIAST